MAKKMIIVIHLGYNMSYLKILLAWYCRYCSGLIPVLVQACTISLYSVSLQNVSCGGGQVSIHKLSIFLLLILICVSVIADHVHNNWITIESCMPFIIIIET